MVLTSQSRSRAPARSASYFLSRLTTCGTSLDAALYGGIGGGIPANHPAGIACRTFQLEGCARRSLEYHAHLEVIGKMSGGARD